MIEMYFHVLSHYDPHDEEQLRLQGQPSLRQQQPLGDPYEAKCLVTSPTDPLGVIRFMVPSGFHYSCY